MDHIEINRMRFFLTAAVRSMQTEENPTDTCVRVACGKDSDGIPTRRTMSA